MGHACVDIYQGAVAALIPFFVAERDYTYAVASGIVLAASLLSSVAQPMFGALTDRRAMPWLLPVSTLLGGVGIALSGLSGSYGLTLLFVAVSGVGVAAYHPESARVARLASEGSHSAMAWFSLGGNIGFSARPAHGGGRDRTRLPALDTRTRHSRARRRRPVRARPANARPTPGRHVQDGGAPPERGRCGLVREAVPGGRLPLHRLHRPEHLHLPLRPAAHAGQHHRGTIALFLLF